MASLLLQICLSEKRNIWTHRFNDVFDVCVCARAVMVKKKGSFSNVPVAPNLTTRWGTCPSRLIVANALISGDFSLYFNASDLPISKEAKSLETS